MQQHQDWSDFLSSSVLALSINENQQDKNSTQQIPSAEFSFSSSNETGNTWRPLGQRSHSAPVEQTPPGGPDNIWVPKASNKQMDSVEIARPHEVREGAGWIWDPTLQHTVLMDANRGYLHTESDHYSERNSNFIPPRNIMHVDRHRDERNFGGPYMANVQRESMHMYPGRSSPLSNPCDCQGYYGMVQGHHHHNHPAMVMPMSSPLIGSMNTSSMMGVDMGIGMGMRVIPRPFSVGDMSHAQHFSGEPRSHDHAIHDEGPLSVSGLYRREDPSIRPSIADPRNESMEMFYGKSSIDPRRSKSVDYKHSQPSSDRSSPILASPQRSPIKRNDRNSPGKHQRKEKAPSDFEEWMGPKTFFEVEFKRYRKDIFVGSSDFALGSYVKVEADRGEDLGRIIQVMQGVSELRRAMSPTEKNDGSYCPPKKVDSMMKRVLRIATEEEMMLAKQKLKEEEEVLEICRSKVRQRLLPMNVIDAEFQFDRHKLTFFFEAERRIDFRELVRDLFAIYKTRIWLQQVVPLDKKKIEPQEERENL